MHHGPIITTVRVEYSHRDGWHVFKSKELPGLLIASKNAEQAFNDVPKTIKLLVELDTGMTFRVEQELSFEDFLHAARGDAIKNGTRNVVASRNYVVEKEAA